MAYEIKVFYHPRKEEGSGYNTEVKEETLVKVGSGFEDTPLEKLAGVAMAQLARRDVWVVDLEIQELVRRPVSFKESKDGKGIVLKNKRFSVNSAAQMVSEDLAEVPVITNMQPHELVHGQRQQSIDDLYSNPNKLVPVKRDFVPKTPINPNKTLYRVIFDPVQWEPEAKRLGLKFTLDREYPVHKIIEHPTGKLNLQKIAVTDDLGRIVEVDEKYFTTSGMGLMADRELGFSGSSNRGARKPKLAFEDQMFSDGADPSSSKGIPSGIPVDDGTIPSEFLEIIDIRKAKR